MTDDDRVRLASRRGGRMVGPVERERCQAHPTRWTSYRWTWPVDATIEDGDVEVVRGCVACRPPFQDA